jgi:hypothetical protein
MHRDRTEASEHQVLGLLAPAVAARTSLRTAIWSARPPIYRGLCMAIVTVVFGSIGVWLSPRLLPDGGCEMVCAPPVGGCGVVSAGPERRFRAVDDIHSRDERP